MDIHIPTGNPSPDLGYSFSSPSSGWLTSGASPSMAHEMTAWDCARTLYRRKATLMDCGLRLIAAALVTLAQPRMYRSQASIQVRRQRISQPSRRLSDWRDQPKAGLWQTQAEMLQQDSLIDRGRKLRLNGRALDMISAGEGSARRAIVAER